MINQIAKQIIEILPQNAISRGVGVLGRSSISRYIIKPYSKIYKINLDEMEQSLGSYPNFTAFFTRKLKAEAREVAADPYTLSSPVDGKVAEYGDIKEGTLIQAKGIDYRVEQLIGCTKEEAERFDGGTFLTIYLSPSDYHRIHMPLSGAVTKATYLPGRLFPVNRIGVEHVPGLFTKNERLITYVDTQAGTIALVKVGAFIVGSVRVPYGNHTTNVKNGKYYTTSVNDTFYEKGEEVGLFEFGSTVVLLFERDKVKLTNTLERGTKLKYGEPIGTYKSGDLG
ncbi:archaetidylserine decarboxylase [Priestia flexa]|jgi:phosphatidylserine decarboxylase|uniref:archaetidylserine decarboxylase n=1 Tax=Priestia flexa TaxID=86664 RepID=UPI000E6805CE|nr:archaetidylserine decarboxylase [Priestia flexa]MBN8435626.1 phosphatidylserine decarboxylase [Priestia flexa]MCA0968184.1 archaetidylserine decarboxylase [Priestia flexa]RIV06436.1 phosphatidylserine decarboxylase [Priestia flexa]UIR30495.1 archaetidylserine decarboxylase [Priestia flexa]UZW66549.1 archaetidylserine decarboxylase [Priestia flexa]